MAGSSTSGGHAFDSILPLASASSSGRKPLPYDVYINHHGGDVKHTLASSIYNSLVSTGLRVFLDKDEVKLGDFWPKVLEEAMRSASIHIAIFSEQYAQSPWHLAELAFMLETGHVFIPVFYYVEPLDLRWAVAGKGIYADAFSMYEKKGRYSPEQVQRWKQALHQASFYAGEIIRNQHDVQRVVKNVANLVMKEMNKVPLEVAKHPVGLDEAVQNFNKIALQSPGPIQIVGIWGMGGSGKTTLAKEIFNNRCSAMDRSSFLFDLRDAARKGLLVEKQKKLLKDFDVKDIFFDNVDEGKMILKSCLRSVSVLIILDDVDHTDQLDALLPGRDMIGYGSLIVVTTCHLDVLKAWGISTIYQMRPLNATHAKQLFCWHAFLQPSPPLEFEDLVKKFLNASNRLPLSLKVLGAQLYGEYSKDYWQSQLDKLSRILPEDIKSRLKTSYDGLNMEEKEMFLDTACFFIGQRISVAIAVWHGSGWAGLHGWEILFNKCFVEVDENGFITMHNHLRDLGREIANRQSPYRLWSPQQLIQIHPQQEAIRIRGMANAIGDNCYPCQGKIIIHTDQGERSLVPHSLGLEIFVGNGDFLRLEHSELSRELVWLQCNQFEHKNLPSWLSLKNLRILELFDPRSLEDLWERDVDAPLQLRELVIQRCNSLRGFPRSIGLLRNLRKILIGQDYVNCDTLSSLPQEFCHLHSLEHLEIKWCRNLSSLPSNFGELTNLQHLNLNGCTKLKLFPNSFEKLILLEYLNLQGCGELIIKSCILENMTKLRYLNLDGCRKLEDLRLPEVASLTELYLKGTSLKELPANIFQQTKLTELVIGSEFLTTLPISLGNLSSLTRLGIQGCKELESLPNSLGNLSSLTRLAIQGCKELEFLPDSLEHLNFLRDLDIKQSGVKKLPKSFIHLQSLNIDDTPISELSFGSGCMLRSINLHSTKVSKISISGDSCPFLETLSLEFNKNLWYLETLPATLKRIVVIDCNVLKHIRGVGGLKNLQTLEIKDCGELEELPSLAELVSLETFILQGSSRVKEIAGLQELRSLRELRIELIELPSLAELTSLKKIELQNCYNLEKIESLKHLYSLDELKISDHLGLKALPSLKEITSLKELQLITCHKLEKIEGLENLKSLETLRIYDCPELDGLPCLTELTSLKKLYLQMYQKLEKVEGLERLRSLETLKISDCPELDGLPSLAELTSLAEFDLRMCHKLKKIEGLEQLRSLEKLEVHTRWKAPCIVSLEQCERLKSLAVVANDRSAIEPFISNRQKWPREVITCTRAVFDVGSLKNYFELPNVYVLDFDMLQTGLFGFLELRRPESSANANTILICLIIDCNDPDLDFYVRPGIDNCFDPDYFNTELGKGKCVWMGVFTQGSEWLLSNLGISFLCVSSEDKVNVKVEEAWLVMGEEGSIIKAFNQLFQSNEQRVVKEMNKVPLEVSTHPVGLDEAVQEFETIALQSAGPIQIVGIAGMGGSGKTMLAKEIYNRKYQTMRRSTFLSDVRDAAVKGLLVEKQKKLLEDLDVEGSTFDNEEQILQSRLRSLSVLIILDDVNHRDQLEALLPAQQSLGVGSLIIVTTRDLNVLKAWGISAIYQTRALNNTNAKQLFCWHAFGQPSPLSGFEDLVERFISASHGLPLSLEVLGRQVRGKSMSYLEAQLNNNSRKLPANIKQRLKISYDELDEEEKQMFLDTACFFIGEENSLAITVWDGSEWNGLHGWESLFNKHLVYLDENNRITMHDHWRDLGREIADQQSPYRLRSSWQLNQIQPQQEHIKIRGMINATGADCYSLQGKILIDRNEVSRSLVSSSLGLKLLVGSGEFRNQEVGELSRELLWLRSRRLELLGLKLLVGSGEFRYQEVGELSRELLWLRWDDFNHTNLPPWLSLKNLRVLELNGALNLQELWTDDAHAPLQLRELIITGTWSASFERFPSSISYLNHLRKIELLGDVGKEFGIKGLPEEFCDLQSLEHLELRHCTLLSSLPARFGDLRNLRRLDLCSCKGLRMLPVSFQQLTYLKYLDLSGCKRLVLQKDILENITQLENLYLSGCLALQELPHQITDQASMKELRLQHTSLQDLPSDIGQLCKLQVLTIGSPLLKSLPDSFGDLSSLKSLSIIDCFAMESLPRTLGHLELLEHLCLEATGVRSLPEGFRQLANLRTLKISDCPLSELDFGSVSSFSLEKLTEINLSETLVTRISISQHCCPRLQTLRLTKNDYLEEIETLPATVNNIELSGCETLKNIKGSHAFPILPKLAMSDCPEELEKPSEF